jgi:predicted XRE-type DNA-binding protein
MAKEVHEVLWKLREDTANEISELQVRQEMSDWLDEQSELTTIYAKELATVVHLLEQELSNHGLSLKTHTESPRS